MKWVTALFLFVLFMINYADKSIAGFSAVHIMEEFNLTAGQWGIVGSSFFWLFSIAGIIGAGLSDKIGTKKMLAILAICWTVVQVGAFVIYSLPMLIFARILLGIGEGPTWATMVSHLSKWFPERQKGMIFSLVNFGAFIGAVVLTPILVNLIELQGWRVAWAFLGVLSFIWLILWIFLGKERPVIPEEPMLTSKEYIPKANRKQIVKVLFSASFIFSFFIYFAQMWGTAFSTVWLPVYLVKVTHLPMIKMGVTIGITGIIAGIMTIFISTFADYLYKKTNLIRKSYVPIGGISVILGGIFFYIISITSNLTLILIALTLGQGFAFSVGTISSVIASGLLPERRGLIVGTMSGLVTVAGILSPIVTGNIVEAAGSNVALGFNHAMIINAIIFIITGILFLLFVKRDEKGLPSNSIPHQIVK